MQDVNEVLRSIDGYVGGAQWFVFFLLGVGLFFTIYLKFPQIRYFNHALRIVRGKYDKSGDEGDTSHFQALATALSGTVGTGNIAGVALAIHLGGPASLFWMLVTAMLGMTTKFVEVTLSHKYREKAVDGTISGGPMYYMKNKLKMKWLAALFAVATILSSFGTGSLPQINTIADAINNTFGVAHIVTGGVLAVLLGVVIVGGIKRIAKVTERLVPAMALIYLIGAFSVLLYNYDNIIPSIVSVFSNIFSGSAALGGFIGASVIFAFKQGVNRGLFSNEAGQGSAPIAHAAARTKEPVSEGMVAILEPFIDTIVICMITGVVILSSGVWSEKFENKFETADLILFDQMYDQNNEEDINKIFHHLSGDEKLPLLTASINVNSGVIDEKFTIIHARSFAEDVLVYEQQNNKKQLYSGLVDVKDGQLQKLSKSNKKVWLEGKSLLHSSPLTIEAFKRSLFGNWGQYIVSIGLLLFAFSTAISWSYYGGRSVTYLWGSKYVIYYRIVYVIGFFFASFADTTIIWTFSGITISLMALPNLIGILMLHKDMKQSIKDYWITFNKTHQ